jgi:hypothetical protein
MWQGDFTCPDPCSADPAGEEQKDLVTGLHHYHARLPDIHFNFGRFGPEHVTLQAGGGSRPRITTIVTTDFVGWQLVSA